jgi:peptidoglycan L-alanyl-D-glutamate endopeptidase CwlK
MPKFGKRSKDRLKGVDAKLQNVLNEVVKIYDVFVIEGVRSKERQKELYAQGATKVLYSKHMDGLAVDIAPYPYDPDDIKRFFYMAGIIKTVALSLRLTVRWGGDWNQDQEFAGRDPNQKFNDYVHFEILD